MSSGTATFATATYASRSASVATGLTRTLELPMALRIPLPSSEHFEPERDRDDADNEQRPDLVPHGGHAVAVQDRVAYPVQRIGRGRDRRQPLHPLGQHGNRVVDARDHEQHPLRDEPELRPFLG